MPDSDSGPHPSRKRTSGTDIRVASAEKMVRTLQSSIDEQNRLAGLKAVKDAEAEGDRRVAMRDLEHRIDNLERPRAVTAPLAVIPVVADEAVTNERKARTTMWAAVTGLLAAIGGFLAARF